MLRNDNLRLISLALCWFYTNGVIALTIKPDTLDVLLQIPGIKLTNEDLRRYHIWPQGIIPYYIDDFSFDKVLRDRIRSYLDQLNKVTGLHFMEIPQPPEDDDNRWVFFVNRKGQLGCADVAYHNFTYTGVQRVVLGYDCLRSEDLDEIILALVGVPPQHNSPDRDDYITVNLDNIVPDKHYLFKKLQPEEWAFSKLKYDYSSAGHYYTHKYTSNGVETMTLKNRENNLEGSKGLSATDITKIRMLYNYISFKDKELRKVPECSKLFVPGKNFSKYIPSNNSIINPEINQDVDKKGKGDKEIEDNADNKDEINDEESLKQDNSKEADPNTDNQESKEQFESPDEQKLHTDINKRPKSKEKNFYN